MSLIVKVFGCRPITSRSAGTGAVVRKPAGKESAGSGAQRRRTLYGDFDAAGKDAGADDVAGGAIAKLRGAGEEARLARQRGARPNWGLRDGGSDERCRGWPWTSETDRHSSGG
jgi:hypothetical protein